MVVVDEESLCVWECLTRSKEKNLNALDLHAIKLKLRGENRFGTTDYKRGVEIKSMIDLVLVKKDMLHYVQGVRVMRGMGRGLSEHHVVLCKVRLVGAWWWLGLGGLEERN